MIKTETYTIHGVPFVRTYSDANRYVARDGVSYDEANDPASLGRTYTEGDVIQTEEDEVTTESVATELLENGLVTLPTEDEPDYLNEREEEPNYFA